MGKYIWRLIQADFTCDGIDITQYISHNCHPIGLAEVDDMACSMTRRMDNTKPGYFVAIMQHALNRVRGSRKQKLYQLRGGIPGLHMSASLHTGNIRFMAGEGDTPGFTDAFDRTLMIGVTMGQS